MTTTKNQEDLESANGLLSSEERSIVSHVAAQEAPYSLRAQALLAIDEGASQNEAGIQAGLTKGQVRYWLGKFRKEGTSIFPEELVNEALPEQDEAQQELQAVAEAADPIDEATAQEENTPKANKKGKKKSKKKSKKAKKSKKIKKPKKAKKKKKGKKSKKKSKKKRSKKANGKSSKKGKKKSKK